MENINLDINLDIKDYKVPQSFAMEELQYMHTILNEWFDEYGRHLCEPPINGDITLGKLKSRGIKLCCYQFDPITTHFWFEQRGEQFTPRFEFTITPIKY